jgi:hypothetical protein
MKHPRAWLPYAVIATAFAACPSISSASWLFGGMASAIANSVQLGETDNCIAPTAKVGDVIKMTENYVGIVKAISGPSAICDDSSQVRARVDVRLSEAARTAEHTICVARGLGKGDRIKDVGLGEMQIKSITSSPDCSSDPRAPIQAVAVSTQGPLPTTHTIGTPVPATATAPSNPAPTQVPVVAKPIAVKAAEATAPVQAPAKAQGTSETAEKLRELAGMLKDGLITQDDYDAKKKELLKSF